MAFDRHGIVAFLTRLGSALRHPATLCLIGSTPAILAGQSQRQTGDIDVWDPASDFDYGDLEQACRVAGALFDPKSDLSPSDIYLQIVRPGVVALPRSFSSEVVARFGKLTVVMPPPAIIVASKLVRGDERDVDDVVWWLRQRNLGSTDVEEAISILPGVGDREVASENLVVVRLVGGKPE